MIVYLLWPMVVWTGDPPPRGLVHDTCMPNAPDAAIGQVWNGSAFVAPVPGSEMANAAALWQQADDAIAANVQTVADIDAWLAGPGAGTSNLTSAQLSSAVRQLMREARVSAKQRNATIRLLRGKLDATS
jgi:hypothetical protein